MFPLRLSSSADEGERYERERPSNTVSILRRYIFCAMPGELLCSRAGFINSLMNSNPVTRT
jgi:hypothetical protein